MSDADPIGAAEESASDSPPVTPLLAPREGVPPVLSSATDFADAAQRLAAGSGPVALDTERASGYRYSQRAYLIQIRRTGAGSFLLDPIEEPEALRPVIDALAEPEWILHAADQDLPCLRELGFHATTLFDTELAGRLLGLTKVNLAAMVEQFLGFGLQKGHGAADWSKRPLPAEWLNYAALDVEVLIELRDAMDAALRDAGKSDWAAEEFAYVLRRLPSPPRTDRWRRTANIHTVKTARGLAAVRELWSAREEIAQRRDVAPGRVLPDSAIITAAAAAPSTTDELTRLPVFGGPRQRRQAGIWLSALLRARDLPEAELPPRKTPATGPPPISRWDQRNPEAAARASAVRPLVKQIAEEHTLPPENLLTPDLVRQLCWEGIDPPITEAAVDARLAAGDARDWQRSLTVGPITAALNEATSSTSPTPDQS
ncbi:ribonuclease D [Gordonia polyisoprenivorans]|uniref:ribonuclease D n=1 Tax=Gordonia polyisoprenivorans TaxID=84595 RepID=UPI002301B189|nr:ribonuclease D [Gordonia polyisoprenivorans]WCB39824.1 ribonuclease D [Gordonia polyisoprenivorans]